MVSLSAPETGRYGKNKNLRHRVVISHPRIFRMHNGQPEWLATPAAAQLLGRSPEYLKKARDLYPGGFLEEKTHYILGPSANSSILWNVEAVQKALHQRGIEARKEHVEKLAAAKAEQS